MLSFGVVRGATLAHCRRLRFGKDRGAIVCAGAIRIVTN
jgi:hypothetical protein